MKQKRFPKLCIKLKLFSRIICATFLVMAGAAIICNTADAKKEFTADFNNFYGTAGTDGGTTMGSCITCHVQLNGKGGLNLYGKDWKAYGSSFAAIEPLDSDGDSYDNLTEILVDTFPGDASDYPAPTNKLPVANAGPNQTVDEGANVILDGSNSYDPDGVIISFKWTQTGGMLVTLSDSTADKPTFTAPQVGPGDELLTFRLTVTDNDGDSSSDTVRVTISWVNNPPIADAGPDQTVDGGVDVTLDGSNSTDTDGGVSTYQWVQTSGPSVTLSEPSAIQPTFISPLIGSSGVSLSFQLTVTDGFDLSAADVCIVNVTNGNLPPVANAGGDQTVNEGDIVTLDASASNDSDGSIVSFRWAQTSGPPVTLSDTLAIQPTFTAPDVGFSGDSLTFEVAVTDDGGLQATDTCIVNVSWVNLPPIADAGPDQSGAFSVEEGNTVTLDGSGSTDSDDGIVSYLWEQTGAGPAVTLSDPTAVRPTFVTPVVEAAEVTLTFQLTVTDSGGLQASDVVLVEIYDNGIEGFPEGAITLKTADGTPLGITEDSGGNITKLNIIDPADLPGGSETPEDLILGLIDLQVKTGTPGAAATFTIYLSQSAPSGYKWYKYNFRTNVWTDYTVTTTSTGANGAVFNEARDQVRLTLVDGDVGDDDSLPNGIIEDPSGLGAADTFSSPAGSNSFGGGGGCFIVSAASDHRQMSVVALAILGLLPVITGVMVLLRSGRKTTNEYLNFTPKFRYSLSLIRTLS